MGPSPGDNHDLIELLAHRGHILPHLESGPKPKPTLVDELGVSRSTVDRAVRDLETHDLVTREAGTVTLTTRGGVALDLYRYLTDVVAGLLSIEDALGDIPLEDRPHFSMFGDATIVTGSEAAPYHPISVYEDELSNADHVRALSMTVIPPLVDYYQDRIVEGDLNAEIVVSEAVLSRLVSSHTDALQLSLDHDQVTVYQTDASLPYGVTVLDSPNGRSAMMHLHGDGGIAAMVQSASPAAVAWADSLVTQHRNTATPV